MRKKPRLLLDVDGVIANFAGAAVRVMNKISGMGILEEQIREWDVTTMLDDEEHRRASKDAFNEAGFASTFESYDGSVDAVHRLREITELHFVTAPTVTNPTWVHDRVNWLAKHFGVDPRDVHHTAKKWVLYGDVMIDDHPVNLEPWLQHWPGKLALLWDRSYNQGQGVGLHRIKTWAEAISAIEALSV
jgi:5'(3')-deoxyribonucleotidase